MAGVRHAARGRRVARAAALLTEALNGGIRTVSVAQYRVSVAIGSRCRSPRTWVSRVHHGVHCSPNETGRATGRAVCVSLGAAPGSGWRDGAVSDRAARPGEDRSAAQ